jgi:hypothetical protein
MNEYTAPAFPGAKLKDGTVGFSSSMMVIMTTKKICKSVRMHNIANIQRLIRYLNCVQIG